MTKKEFNVLEKVFAFETNGSLYQGKCKSVKKLKDEGYIMMSEKLLGADRFGIIRISGYRTTFKGNAYYCMNCGEPEEE